MEEMFEYLVPLQGFFKKKRSPKIIASYKNMDDFDEVVEDFITAKPYLDDAVRIGQRCIFRKEQVTIFYVADILKATFRVHGCDSTDEFGSIDLLFRDDSEEVMYKTPEIDAEKVTAEVYAALNAVGIKTTYALTR